MQEKLASLAKAADPGEAMKKMDGVYQDKDAQGNEMESRLPQASMPQGKDPKSFSMGKSEETPQR